MGDETISQRKHEIVCKRVVQEQQGSKGLITPIIGNNRSPDLVSLQWAVYVAVKKSLSVQKVFTKERFDNKYALAVTCDQEVLLPILKKKNKNKRLIAGYLDLCNTA